MLRLGIRAAHAIDLVRHGLVGSSAIEGSSQVVDYHDRRSFAEKWKDSECILWVQLTG